MKDKIESSSIFNYTKEKIMQSINKDGNQHNQIARSNNHVYRISTIVLPLVLRIPSGYSDSISMGEVGTYFYNANSFFYPGRKMPAFCLPVKYNGFVDGYEEEKYALLSEDLTDWGRYSLDFRTGYRETNRYPTQRPEEEEEFDVDFGPRSCNLIGAELAYSLMEDENCLILD